MPPIPRSVPAFLWAVGFGVYIWLGGDITGFGFLAPLLVGIVAAAGIFVYIRRYGADGSSRP